MGKGKRNRKSKFSEPMRINVEVKKVDPQQESNQFDQSIELERNMDKYYPIAPDHVLQEWETMTFLFYLLEYDPAEPGEIRENIEKLLLIPSKKAFFGMSIKDFLANKNGFYYNNEYNVWYIEEDEARETIYNLYNEFVQEFGSDFNRNLYYDD